MASLEYSSTGKKLKQRRIYFCRPCGEKHPSPTNGKCTRGAANEAEGAQPTEPRELRGRRSSRRTSTVAQVSKGKRKRVQSSVSNSDSDGERGQFGLILRRLDSIATEGREARRQLADESRREREAIKQSLTSLQMQSKNSQIVSDEEDEVEPVVNVPSTSGARRPLTPEVLERSQDRVQKLRGDTASAAVANKLLIQGAAHAEDGSNKKIKSGYLLTVNDNASIQAQWPQLNVFRSTNAPATYGSLSIDEFCSGFLMYAEDALRGPKPNVLTALDYLVYLRDLMDEVPSLGWEDTRAAHGEVLRQVEQDRLDWHDVQARTRTLAKAVMRARFAPSSRRDGNAGNTSKWPQGLSPQLDRKPCVAFQTQACPKTSTPMMGAFGYTAAQHVIK